MINLTINNSMMLMITIALFILIFIVVLIIMYKDKKKNQKEIDEMLLDLRKDRKEKETIEELTKEIEKVEKDQKTEELDNRSSQVKIGKNSDNEEVSFENKKTEIEEMLEKMQEDLNKQPEEIVTEFENEQEEKAIISYQELVESIKTKSPKVEILDDELEYKQNSKLNETIKKIENKNEEAVKEAVKKFKKTDFISPVYGKMNEHLEYPTVPSFEKNKEEKNEYLELENRNIDHYLDEFDFKNNMEINSLEKTLDMPPISKEIKKNDEFLQALKEFRKNLD